MDTPPGWYAYPTDGTQRYWDGEKWSPPAPAPRKIGAVERALIAPMWQKLIFLAVVILLIRTYNLAQH